MKVMDMAEAQQLAGWLDAVAADQDKAAFKQLFDHYSGRIKAFAMKSPGVSGSAAMAEEIVQETMIKVWNKASLYDRSKANVDAWVYTIARNVRIDIQRRNKKHDACIEVDEIWQESDEPGPLVQLRQRQLADNIRAGLEDINPEQALVLKKMYLEGKSQREIAEEFDIPLGTVKSRTRLALARLRLLLQEKEL